METQVFGEGIERVGVRRICDGIDWITHCLGDQAKNYYADYFSTLPDADRYAGSRIVDYPFSAFLIRDEKNLLIDTIAPRQQDNLLRALESLLGDEPLDYIWISHVELPHAGNAGAITQRYPDAELITVAGGDHYRLHNLAGARQVAPGEVIELGRHRLEIVEPLFVDHGLSMWAYEQHSGMLFTADWGHNLHEPAAGECFMFLDEMIAGGYAQETLIDDIKVNAWFQFPWLVWADAQAIVQAVENLFQAYDVRIFVPSHGNVIRRDVEKYVDVLAEGMRRAVEMPGSFTGEGS